MQKALELEQFPPGQRLRLIRHARGLTLWDVAKEVGVHPGRISELERGQRDDPSLAEQIAKLLGEI